jgi:hypothetical protein
MNVPESKLDDEAEFLIPLRSCSDRSGVEIEDL